MRLAILVIVIFTIFPFAVNAQIVINEIMYDLEGQDDGQEWIEILNTGSDTVDLSGWKLYEAGVNHKINLAGGNNNFIIPSGGYAVIADNPEKFTLDWPNFSGTVFDSSFSLSNVGESIILRDSGLNDIDSVSYTSEWGANGDGNSLQKISGNWKVASPTPVGQNSNFNNPVVGENQQTQTQNQTQQTQIYYGSASSIAEKQIKVYAGEDRLGVAGAGLTFSGKALGLKDEPLDSARFIWNFGDGSFKEGRAVNHIYSFPGDYIAVLDVASGEYAASDIIAVKIIPNEIIISEASPLDSWIELYNGSKELIDISFWGLSGGEKVFIFPKNTLIKPKSYLVISKEISGLALDREKGEIKFLYPNGSLADNFVYEGKIKEGESFVFAGGKTIIVNQTPGKENAETRSPIQNQPASVLIQSQALIQNKSSALPQEFQKKASNRESKTKILNVDKKSNSENNLENAASSVPAEIESSVLSDSENQANVLESAGNFSKIGKWILIVFGVVIFSGAGFWILKKSI